MYTVSYINTTTTKYHVEIEKSREKANFILFICNVAGCCPDPVMMLCYSIIS